MQNNQKQNNQKQNNQMQFEFADLLEKHKNTELDNYDRDYSEIAYTIENEFRNSKLKFPVLIKIIPENKLHYFVEIIRKYLKENVKDSQKLYVIYKVIGNKKVIYLSLKEENNEGYYVY